MAVTGARFREVPQGRWPSGIDKGLAVLRSHPDELAARYGLTFTTDEDEFDPLTAAGVALPSGRLVVFSRNEHDPADGTTVSIDDGDSATHALDELKRCFCIDDAELTWVSDEVTGTHPEPPQPIARGGAPAGLLTSVGTALTAFFRRGRALM